jgi:hypothetical protein
LVLAKIVLFLHLFSAERDRMKRRTFFTILALTLLLTLLLNVPRTAFAQSSVPLPNMPTANNTVRAIVPDGAGGVYIGGDFTQLTPASGPAVTRNRIARINADGSIHAWNPNANSTVQALAVSGSTVYAGGAFTTIGGQARRFFAAFGPAVQPTPIPARPAEVPEADTLLLLGGGLGGLATWLRWQRRKRRAGT